MDKETIKEVQEICAKGLYNLTVIDIKSENPSAVRTAQIGVMVLKTVAAMLIILHPNMDVPKFLDNTMKTFTDL